MAWLLTRSAATPLRLMAILFVILLITLGLALRAATVSRRVSLAGSDGGDDAGLVDAYARTSLLVFLSLLGLFALGLAYGNVLGAGTGP
ncbi:MAG TPA: hypothetical protein VEL12_04640 [Candidatus Nitrosopolaris sp.]|nr:hypothetical protein [Candidatus Nitrosopolaris sp.]